MDFLLTRGLDSGLDSTDVYIYKGALLPVELLRLQHSICFLASGLAVSGICHYIEEQGERLIGHLEAVVAITVEQF